MAKSKTIPSIVRPKLRDVSLDAVRNFDAGVFHSALEATRDGVTISDARLPDMPLVFVNAAFERMTGYLRNDILGRNCRFLQKEDHAQSGIAEIRKAIEEQQDCLVTIRNYRRDGELFHNELSMSPVKDASGTVTHYIGIQKDVTARVSREILINERGSELEGLNKKLKRLASSDPLTGLHNRRMFSLTLNREWRRALRDGGTLSLFMIDVDNFKQVNDKLGHSAGDSCLRSIGGAMSRVFSRATDYVARFGGDEFVVLSAGMNSVEAVEQGERLLHATRGLQLGSSDIPVSVSIGVCSAIVHTDVVEQDLLAAADTALYRAKNAGRDRLDSMDILKPPSEF